MRIGHGYDVHRLVPDRKLILGGVDIPYEKGLLGHSDADVLVHALMDALLGAAACARRAMSCAMPTAPCLPSGRSSCRIYPPCARTSRRRCPYRRSL